MSAATHTTTEALAQATQGFTMSLAKQLSVSGLIPRALKDKPADVLVILLTGRELGLEPMQSLRSIHVIDGKPMLAADLLVGLCVRQRDLCEFFRLVDSSDTVATYEAKRTGNDAVKLSFTLAQAAAAGLAGRDTWRKYPAAMLRARCAAALARVVFPDLVAGIYDPDELATDAPPMEPPRRLRAVNDAEIEPKAPAHNAATGEVVDEPPASVQLPNGAPPEPKTEAFDRWLAAEIDKATTEADLRQLALEHSEKVLNRLPLRERIQRRQGELRRRA